MTCPHWLPHLSAINMQIFHFGVNVRTSNHPKAPRTHRILGRIAATTKERAQQLWDDGHRNVADYIRPDGEYLSLAEVDDAAESVTFYPNL